MATEQQVVTPPRLPSPAAPYPIYDARDHRLSTPRSVRIPLATAIAFLGGLGLGVANGSRMAGLIYRAENAHRLPTTNAGWYFYHKSKNYVTALGGIKEGIKMGTKVGIGGAMFFTIEEAVDEMRGDADCLNTAVAALGTAGAFSLWNRFPLPAAARTAKLALIAGLGYGLAQDAIAALRGRKITYVEALKGMAQESRT